MCSICRQPPADDLGVLPESGPDVQDHQQGVTVDDLGEGRGSEVGAAAVVGPAVVVKVHAGGC
jgi:hypothetical protein